MSAGGLVEDVTCLGCGCACDDITVRVADGRIAEAARTCALGAAWFGDGQVPWRILIGGRPAALDEALQAAADLARSAESPLVYLAADLTCDAQREGVAAADLLRGSIDGLTSSTTLGSLLASQERGRAGATLGEVANRADVIVYWGVDPGMRYPRFVGRYGHERPGLHLAGGRRSRRVVSVDVGAARGPADADERFAIAPGQEVAALVSLGHGVSAPPAARGDSSPETDAAQPLDATAAGLTATLRSARYAAVVADAEPDVLEPQRDPGRGDALLALSQALNERTRGALVLLRAGGNRSGAEAVLTWQTGFPAAVDFARGIPRYRPFDGTARARLARGACDLVVVLGAPESIPADLVAAMTAVRAVAIGPRVSLSPFASGPVAIDTGVAGIHEAGLALRMDDVPVPVRAPLGAPRSTKTIAAALCERIVAVRSG